jgi:hypothetical protein
MSNVHMSPGGLPETILDPEPDVVVERLGDALSLSGDDRRAAVAAVVADHPSSLTAWAELGDLGRDHVEAYAAYRVGYHRGLDRLRQSGWRGSGMVRWRHESNRGFLRALYGLARMADAIGEDDESHRCQIFLRQLDPEWEQVAPTL